MGRDLTAEQVRAEYMRVLGPDLGPVYYAIYNEVVFLHAKWKQYRILFASKESVDLLNQAAAFFFRIIQDALWENVVLHLARLTDPPESVGKKKNLTLQCLGDLIPDAGLAKEVRALVGAVLAESKFARDWRNRYLAHRCLDLAVGTNPRALTAGSRASMERALAAVRAVLNRIEGHYQDAELGFEILPAKGDAKLLLRYVKLGVTGANRRRERLPQGRPLPEHIEDR